MTIEQIIAAELKVKPQQVHAALELLDGGQHHTLYCALPQRSHRHFGRRSAAQH